MMESSSEVVNKATYLILFSGILSFLPTTCFASSCLSHDDCVLNPHDWTFCCVWDNSGACCSREIYEREFASDITSNRDWTMVKFVFIPLVVVMFFALLVLVIIRTCCRWMKQPSRGETDGQASGPAPRTELSRHRLLGSESQEDRCDSEQRETVHAVQTRMTVNKEGTSM